MRYQGGRTIKWLIEQLSYFEPGACMWRRGGGSTRHVECVCASAYVGVSVRERLGGRGG